MEKPVCGQALLDAANAITAAHRGHLQAPGPIGKNAADGTGLSSRAGLMRVLACRNGGRVPGTTLRRTSPNHRRPDAGLDPDLRAGYGGGVLPSRAEQQ
jgi:hypothetical protein